MDEIDLRPEDVPAAIQLICQRLGISQAELGRRLGTYPPTVNRWATGRTPPHRLYLRELDRLWRQVRLPGEDAPPAR